MSRLYGSADLFPDSRDDAFRPQQSINYINSHDGFCLYDLVSYNAKHNLANGHDNRDGADNNVSWNCGVEGDAGASADIVALRHRQAKNFCCLLMLANGTPMFCAGDEFLNPQGGNNNPYNQDNATSWLDWDRLNEHAGMFRFFRQMIAFRKAHPSIARGRFWRNDIRWYGVGEGVDLREDSHTLAYCLHGASEGDRDIYVMINAYWEPLVFTVIEGSPAEWVRVVDTTLPSPNDINEAGAGLRLASNTYSVGPRSVVVLLRDSGT
jgi:glycogen operon protein